MTGSFSTKLKSPGAALIIIGAALFLYILVRAILLSFTHDEGITVMEYATQPWSTINDVNWTNNHLLNSWLCKLNLNWFGASEISFRWPNVFAGLLYIVFAARLLRKILPDNWLRVFAFAMLLCNAFIIDFFGLCRGYGLSMGLLMAGLYYFYRYFETGKLLQYGFTSVVLFALATIANYTLLNFFLLQVGFLMLHALLPLFKKEIAWKQKIVRIISYIITGISIYFFTRWFIWLMLKMRDVGNFNFGGEDGFWNYTVRSLIDFSCGPVVHSMHFLYTLMTWLAIGLFVFGGIVLFFRVERKKISALNWFSIFLFLVSFGCAFAIWLQHRLMGIPFSTDRTALYFLVLFPLLLIVLFFTPERMGFAKLLVGFLFAPAILSFLFSLNFERTLLWPFNAHTREEVQQIIKDTRNDATKDNAPFVAVSFLQYPVYNYYLYAEKASWLNPVTFNETGFYNNADYYMRLDSLDPEPPANYKVTWESPGKHLYRREPFLEFKKIKTLGTIDFEKSLRPRVEGHSGYSGLINEQSMFSEGFSDTLTDTLHAGAIIHCKAFLWTEKLAVQSKLVFDVDVKHDSTRIWKGQYINWQLHNEKQWNAFDYDYVLTTDLYPGDHLFIYFLNDSKINVRVDDFSVSYEARAPN
jgi:hypothetical protein